MNEREFREQERSGRHPPSCTCVDCARKRLRQIQNPPNPLKRLVDFLLRRR